METPNVLDAKLEFICPHCEMAVASNMVPQEDLWAEMIQDWITIHAYVQCPECGEDWEIILRKTKIL